MCKLQVRFNTRWLRGDMFQQTQQFLHPRRWPTNFHPVPQNWAFPIQLWWSHFAKMQRRMKSGADNKPEECLKASTVKFLWLLPRKVQLHCRVRWSVELRWMPPAKATLRILWPWLVQRRRVREEVQSWGEMPAWDLWIQWLNLVQFENLHEAGLEGLECFLSDVQNFTSPRKRNVMIQLLAYNYHQHNQTFVKRLMLHIGGQWSGHCQHLTWIRSAMSS